MNIAEFARDVLWRALVVPAIFFFLGVGINKQRKSQVGNPEKKDGVISLMVGALLLGCFSSCEYRGYTDSQNFAATMTAWPSQTPYVVVLRPTLEATLISVPTPVPTTPTAAPTPTPALDVLVARDTARRANEELGLAFRAVLQPWTSNRFTYWCADAVDDLNKERERRRAELQPKNGLIYASYEKVKDGLFTKSDYATSQLTETGRWGYSLEPITPTKATNVILSPDTIYTYWIRQTSKNPCVYKYIASPMPPPIRTATAVLPTVVATATPLPGLYAINAEPKGPLAFGSPVRFELTFLNTMGDKREVQWFVKIYQPQSVGGLDDSVGETSKVVNTILPGTNKFSSGIWTVTQGKCRYKAEAWYVDSGRTGQRLQITRPDGSRALFDFAFCAGE